MQEVHGVRVLYRDRAMTQCVFRSLDTDLTHHAPRINVQRTHFAV